MNDKTTKLGHSQGKFQFLATLELIRKYIEGTVNVTVFLSSGVPSLSILCLFEQGLMFEKDEIKLKLAQRSSSR